MLGYFFVLLPYRHILCSTGVKKFEIFDVYGACVLPDGKGPKKLPSLRIFAFGQIYLNESGTEWPNPRIK